MNRLIISLLLILLPLAVHAEEPRRIISLSTAITETVYALGAQERLIGVDSTSLYPAAARELPDVGYLRTLAAEGMLSLQPDLVIASHEAGPPQVLEQLRSAGVTVEVIQTGPTVEHALLGMERIGEILGKPDQGRELAERNRTQLSALKTRIARLQTRPRVLFVLGGHGSQPTISGRDTKAATMIELAGGENVATSFTSYRPGSAEALLGMQPDVIIAASHGVTQAGGIEQLMQDSALALTPAGKNGRIIVMDSGYLLGMGPRLGAAAAALSERIYSQTSGQTARADQ